MGMVTLEPPVWYVVKLRISRRWVFLTTNTKFGVECSRLPYDLYGTLCMSLHVGSEMQMWLAIISCAPREYMGPRRGSKGDCGNGASHWFRNMRSTIP